MIILKCTKSAWILLKSHNMNNNLKPLAFRILGHCKYIADQKWFSPVCPVLKQYLPALLPLILQIFVVECKVGKLSLISEANRIESNRLHFYQVPIAHQPVTDVELVPLLFAGVSSSLLLLLLLHSQWLNNQDDDDGGGFAGLRMPCWNISQQLELDVIAVDVLLAPRP